MSGYIDKNFALVMSRRTYGHSVICLSGYCKPANCFLSFPRLLFYLFTVLWVNDHQCQNENCSVLLQHKILMQLLQKTCHCTFLDQLSLVFVNTN